ncbi:MAG TPA: hypothetical protein VJI96_02965 [Candidatus Andersenbacteria bacterium]|nr:hypothetical protein [Candidatus Andersenbacteria bacterium]
MVYTSTAPLPILFVIKVTGELFMHAKLRDMLIQHFELKGGLSRAEAEIAVDCLDATALNVDAETTHGLLDAKCFLAFSFGGRHDALLNVSKPGPQNLQIAISLRDWYRRMKAQHNGPDPFVLHCCVQWEIALVNDLWETIPRDQLHILRPRVNAMNANHDHYPTQRLWEDMKDVLIRHNIDIAKVPVGIFAHRHHLPRVVQYANSIGVTRTAADLDAMPSDFDPYCAYPWTRDFRGFYLSNAVSAMAKMRNEEYCVNPEYFPE